VGTDFSYVIMSHLAGFSTTFISPSVVAGVTIDFAAVQCSRLKTFFLNWSVVYK